jgi:hypothetical protein
MLKHVAVFVVAACLTLAGCSKASNGKDGADGANGTAGVDGVDGVDGDAGPAGAGAFNYYDADGDLVPEVRGPVTTVGVGTTSPPRLTFVDANGLVWSLNPNSGAIGVATALTPMVSRYLTTDCTGAGYLPNALPARVTFNIVDDEATIRFVPDDATFSEQTFNSIQFASNCADISSSPETAYAVPLTLTVPGVAPTPPTFGYTLPLHVSIQ